MNKFKEFLQKRYCKKYNNNYDVEDFKKWIAKLDIDQWLNYGEWFANKVAKELLEKHIFEMKQKIEML
jgi:hypothetical protein